MAKVYKKANKQAGNKTKKNGKKAQKKPSEEMLIEALVKIVGENKSHKLAGLDFGVTNILGMAFADGSDGAIIAGSRFVKKIEHQAKKIDEWKANNMPAALKALLSKRDKLPKGERLSRAEQREIRSLYAEMYSDPKYIAMTSYVERWKDDALKKLAAGAMKILSERGIEALVVGLNKKWKDETDMGRAMNRLFYGVAHTRLVNMLRSAGEKCGILVVTTEESYTSKISFCNNTKLRNYDEEHVKEEEGCADKEDASRTGLSQNGTMRKENGGYRESNNRHVYRNGGDGKGKPKSWRKVVHADMNGSYNILRKMFDWFAFNESLSLNYKLYWLSPKLGVTPMKLSLR